jgi:hypothetical protein
MTTMEFVYIVYRFHLAAGREMEFRVRLDPATFEAVESTPAVLPDWTALSFHRCPNCPLDPATRPHCPAALRFVQIVEKLGDMSPYVNVQVDVTTPERTYSAPRSLQKGLSSLVGLLMATCGCPRTRFLTPMARFHLPFSTDEETLYRTSTMYLLAQYFRFKQGEKPDLELEGLSDLYRELQVVNDSMTERLREGARRDTASHAIVSLDLFSHTLPFDIRSSLSRLRHLYDSYFTT